MGWSYGVNAEGREVGYGVEAICDHEGCDTKIDRGLAYCCGGMHDGGEYGCGNYFCGEHLFLTPVPEGVVFLCDPCGDTFCPDCGSDESDIRLEVIYGDDRHPCEDEFHEKPTLP